MTTYTYRILQLVCNQQIENRPNAVNGIHIEITATDGNLSQSSLGYIPIVINLGDPEFITFEELSEATVRSWIDAQSSLLDEYKSSLNQLLTEMTNPSVLAHEPPWATPISVPVVPITYDQQRRENYPYIGDQLDMLWHAMDTGVLPKVIDFYDTIKTVKDQYPKS